MDSNIASANRIARFCTFLLGKDVDRRAYLNLLWEGKQGWPVSLFAYNLTSNHVHLLLAAEEHDALCGFMAHVSGVMGRQYNRRKERAPTFTSSGDASAIACFRRARMGSSPCLGENKDANHRNMAGDPSSRFALRRAGWPCHNAPHVAKPHGHHARSKTTPLKGTASPFIVAGRVQSKNRDEEGQP